MVKHLVFYHLLEGENQFMISFVLKLKLDFYHLQEGENQFMIKFVSNKLCCRHFRFCSHVCARDDARFITPMVDNPGGHAGISYIHPTRC